MLRSDNQPKLHLEIETKFSNIFEIMIFSNETLDIREKIRSIFFIAIKQRAGKIFIFYLGIDYCWMSKGSILLRCPGLNSPWFPLHSLRGLEESLRLTIV